MINDSITYFRDRIGNKAWRVIILQSLLLFLFAGTAMGVSGPPIPFWSQLQPFEKKAMKNIEASRSADPDALLALALIASGDIRDQTDYNRIRKRTHLFIKNIRQEIDRQTSIYDKGEKLLKAMHANFFKGGRNKAGPELISGYDAEQSKLSAIFEKGRFNCISSAIFYIILARYFDLKVQGVITTEHAFVQIIGDGGNVIEVETTSKKGYGLVHDERFFRKSFSRFSKSRNLSVPTYAAYLKRRVVLPYRLIAENMNHQHTAAARMDSKSRQRLFEIRGYVDPNSVKAQLARLTAYYNGCVDLFSGSNKRDIKKMRHIFSLAEKHIKTQPWINDTERKYVTDIGTRLAAIHIMLGRLLQSQNDFDQAQQHYTRAMAWSPTPDLRKKAQKSYYKLKAYRALKRHSPEEAIAAYKRLITVLGDADTQQSQQARENIAVALWNMGNKAQQKQDWATAAKHFSAIKKWSSNTDVLKKSGAAQARSDAMHHFKNRQWRQAIQYFREELSYRNADTMAITRNNIGAAYIKWGNALFKRKAYEKAVSKYAGALEMLDPSQQKSVYRNISAAYHNMAVPLLNEGRTADALALLKVGVSRFPDCAECWNVHKEISQKVKQSKR